MGNVVSRSVRSSAAALGAAAVFLAAPLGVAAPAYADCGDPGQPPCTGPVPTTDEVVNLFARLTDPSIPAANKTDIVTPGFTPEEAATIDDHLNRMNADRLLPLNFVVTDIQPAPDNLAGATLSVAGGFWQVAYPKPIVLADQGGHWLITHDSAVAEMGVFWFDANRSMWHPVP